MALSKSFPRALGLAGMLLLGAFAANSYAAAEHKHEQGQAATTQLTLNDGKKWATDDALRTSMNSIKTKMEKVVPEIHAGKFTNPKFKALAKDLNTDIANIFKNCRLDKKADAALHTILIPIIDSIEIMEGKKGKADRHEAAVKIIDNLALYGKYFDHPGWQDLKVTE